MPTDIKHPNILLILTDDLGWRDLSCYDSSFHETPHLDQLAADGMRFTQAYATCPVCSPSRASILTGKYPAHIGITDWIDSGSHCHPCKGRLVDVPYLKQLPLSERTLATTLRHSGYRTWHVGKWHLGGEEHLPQNQGFDLNIGGNAHGLPIHGYFSPWNLPGLPEAPEGSYLTDHLTDEAIRLIQEPSNKPFFLNLCHYAVHTPIQAPEPLIEKYRAKARDLGLDQIQPFEIGEAFPTEHKRNQFITRRTIQSDPVYAAMMENLDSNIGRLRAALEATGQADNTLILFTSDNGGLATAEGSPTCNRPLAEGKGWVYEGGTRVPLIVHWPGVTTAGQTSRIAVTGADILPTLLEAADISSAAHPDVDGESFWSHIQTGADLQREAIFWHYPHYGNQGGTPASSIRAGDWKLIQFFEDGRLELYQLGEDPSEKNECHRENAATTERLLTLLEAWRERMAAKIPESNPDWK